LVTDSGNVELHARRPIGGGRLGEFETMWESGTQINDFSGESVAKLRIWANGSLVLLEYIYRNVPSIAPIFLWQSGNATSTDRAVGEVSLQLGNGGCLQIIDDNNAPEPGEVRWYQCTYQQMSAPSPAVFTDFDSMTSTKAKRSDEQSADSVEVITDWLRPLLNILMVFLLFLVVAVIVCLCCCWCKFSAWRARRRRAKERARRQNSIFSEHGVSMQSGQIRQSEEKEPDETDQALSAWAKMVMSEGAGEPTGLS